MKIFLRFSIFFESSCESLRLRFRKVAWRALVCELRPHEVRFRCPLTFRYQIMLHVYTIYNMSQGDVSIFRKFQKFKSEFSINRQMSKTVDKCRHPEKRRKSDDFPSLFTFRVFRHFSYIGRCKMIILSTLTKRQKDVKG